MSQPKQRQDQNRGLRTKGILGSVLRQVLSVECPLSHPQLIGSVLPISTLSSVSPAYIFHQFFNMRQGGAGEHICKRYILLGSVGHPCLPFPSLGHMAKGYLLLSGSLQRKGLSLFSLSWLCSDRLAWTKPAAAGLRGPGGSTCARSSFLTDTLHSVPACDRSTALFSQYLQSVRSPYALKIDPTKIQARVTSLHP